MLICFCPHLHCSPYLRESKIWKYLAVSICSKLWSFLVKLLKYFNFTVKFLIFFVSRGREASIQLLLFVVDWQGTGMYTIWVVHWWTTVLCWWAVSTDWHGRSQPCPLAEWVSSTSSWLSRTSPYQGPSDKVDLACTSGSQVHQRPCWRYLCFLKELSCSNFKMSYFGWPTNITDNRVALLKLF